MESAFLVFNLIAGDARLEVHSDTSHSAFAGTDKSNDVGLCLDPNRLTRWEQ
jgi:hypothetical protein